MNALATAASQLGKLKTALIDHALALAKKGDESSEGLHTLQAIKDLAKAEAALAKADAAGDPELPILPPAKKSPRKRSPRPRPAETHRPSESTGETDDIVTQRHVG